ncbi:hypothetical protein [Nesterenkonia sp.]|uniref:hypothetical protein n=1 Tax=Nesterenkonia sp. TaxID=704201 RepID=UPI002611FE80|nr:hypothetical protein [Nesterenkonia sp.]
MSSRDFDSTAQQPRSASSLPPEPEDVDALLAESLKAQSERDFTWKEPERRPRWWERAERQHSSVAARPSAEVAPSASRSREREQVRFGSVIFALVALALAAWVIASVVFGVAVDPLVVGLVLCTLAGLTLVAAGLRPRPGTRI